MDRRSFIPFALVGLAALGCASGGNTELMQRELRLQEDRIYFLEDELSEKCKELRKCQEELVRAKGGEAPTGSPPAEPAGSAPATWPSDTPPIEVEIPNLPSPPSTSAKPRQSAPTARATNPASPTSNPSSSQPAGKPKQLAGHSSPGGWDDHPENDLRLVPRVASYRTNAAPLNPPPGQVHVRLTTPQPGGPAPLPASPPALSPIAEPGPMLAGEQNSARAKSDSAAGSAPRTAESPSPKRPRWSPYR
jgi:hypothetical protein